MKKILLSFVLLSFLLCNYCFGQTVFQKAYGGNLSSEYCTSGLQTRDGDFILTGYTDIIAGSDVFLTKTGIYGNILWTKIFTGGNIDNAEDIQQTSDEGYIITGYTKSFGAGFNDMFLIKCDSSGSLQWSKTYGGSIDEYAYAGFQTDDGGYIAVGSTHSFGFSNFDLFLVKTDSNGNEIWSKAYGGTGIEYGYDVKQTTDGGFIIAGYTTSFGSGGADIYLIKVGASGNLLWSKVLGGTYDDKAYSVAQISDGGFIIAGSTIGLGAGNADVCLVKTDGSGNILWSKAYGGASADVAYKVQQTAEGGFVIVGNTNSFGYGFGNSDIYFIKTDPDGNILFTKAYGGLNPDDGSFVQQITDGFIIGGTTASIGNLSNSAYLIKATENGISGCNEEDTYTSVTSIALNIDSGGTETNVPSIDSTAAFIVSSSSFTTTSPCFTIGVNELHPSGHSVSIFPDPFSQFATISFQNTSSEKIYFILYDILGQEISKFEMLNPKTELLRGNLPAGVYFYRVTQIEKIIASGKVMID